MPPGRRAELLGQRRVRLHAGDVQVVIGARFLIVRIGPGEAARGRAAADAARLQHRHRRTRRCEAVGDRGAHHTGANHNNSRHRGTSIRRIVYNQRRTGVSTSSENAGTRSEQRAGESRRFPVSLDVLSHQQDRLATTREAHDQRMDLRGDARLRRTARRGTGFDEWSQTWGRSCELRRPQEWFTTET